MGTINKRYSRKVFSDNVFFAYQENIKWLEKSDRDGFSIRFGCVDENTITVYFKSENERNKTFEYWKEFVNENAG